MDYTFRPWEETIDEFWARLDQQEQAMMIKAVHHANPGTDRSAELDILAMANGWLY